MQSREIVKQNLPPSNSEAFEIELQTILEYLFRAKLCKESYKIISVV